jgi:glycosyltransferase involved in cell wall biosynthesis
VRVLFTAWRDLAHPLAGGSEVLVDGLATGLKERGHEVALLCGGPIGQRPYPVVNAGGTYSQYGLVPFHYWWRFRGWDLVVDVENGVPFFAPLWRRGANICLVHHLHRDQWVQRFPRPIARTGWVLERRVMPWAYRRSLFVCVSRSTACSLAGIGIPPARIRVISNGVRLPEAGGEESVEPLFLAISRLVPHKRVDLLLRGWPKVRSRVGGRLVIVGTGPEEGRLRLEAGPGVEFVGHVSEQRKAELLGQCWMLIHAAQHEGWGLVITEAAAASKPAVAFDVPGVRDGIVDGGTGVLVRTDDELVEAWVGLATDHVRRRALGRAARRRAEGFTLSATVDQFLAVAEEALRRG